jgi:hypothetical protein
MNISILFRLVDDLLPCAHIYLHSQDFYTCAFRIS